MDDQFPVITKDNGLKNVQWGSEEFIKEVEQAERKQRIDEEHAEIDYMLSILRGM